VLTSSILMKSRYRKLDMQRSSADRFSVETVRMVNRYHGTQFLEQCLQPQQSRCLAFPHMGTEIDPVS
jgi:hypothetical protein